ncbi:hypothetical protein AMTRI_Chr11g151880 [Amborella trichopoda]|uniref:Transmembrane protein n=1 Tax=Amborella trichopoda TaxID=13333 RepID=U5CS45_AMBTC|nr:uncharacterized protein LOC18444322 [Amborella trichopoda]ERN16026.1 hypothetical protein AMTR_s00030p00094120 [Amborella trichopoda]|eukprot:XP_006854559.1 uncharacterized protein LOC18444322 [Amborella trichopoda]
MADLDQMDNSNRFAPISKETALQALNTIIQLHFEKTLEKKRAVDLQKKQLFQFFLLFFVFLALAFASSALSPRLQCRHCWAPIGLVSLAHLIFYAAMAQTLRCINGFKYQRRCHKLTLGLATEKLRQIRSGNAAATEEEELEIHYQEPPASYFGKFKRNWAMYFGFLVLTFGFTVSSIVALLCF